MLASLTPQEFVAKWRKADLKERAAAAQEHFLDLCRLVGHPTPAEQDPTGHTFTFEAGATKQRGGQGWADVWKKGAFAWEYKGKHKDLVLGPRRIGRSAVGDWVLRAALAVFEPARDPCARQVRASLIGLRE